MTESIAFTYKSVGNLMKLLCTINVENSEEPQEIAIWHEVFDPDDMDQVFEKFLTELYPDGKTIQPEDVPAVVFKAWKYIDSTDNGRSVRNKYTKLNNPYWVYFKPDDKVYPCKFAGHSDLVRDICYEYFKGFDDVDEDYLRRFIITNFEIHSDNSTVETIAKDSYSIKRYITLRKYRVGGCK